MKIPKHLLICGRLVDIKYSNAIKDMAIFNANERTVTINLSKHKETSPEELKDTLLHECLEAIMIFSNFKYTTIGGELFVFDHKQLQHNIVPELLSIIKQVNFVV